MLGQIYIAPDEKRLLARCWLLARAVGVARMASGCPADRYRAPTIIDPVRAEVLESQKSWAAPRISL